MDYAFSVRMNGEIDKRCKKNGASSVLHTTVSRKNKKKMVAPKLM